MLVRLCQFSRGLSALLLVLVVSWAYLASCACEVANTLSYLSELLSYVAILAAFFLPALDEGTMMGS